MRLSDQLSKLYSMKIKVAKEIQGIVDVLSIPTGSVKDMDVHSWIQEITSKSVDMRLRKAQELLKRIQETIDSIEGDTRPAPRALNTMSESMLRSLIKEAKKEKIKRKKKAIMEKKRQLINKRKWEMMPNMLPERRVRK